MNKYKLELIGSMLLFGSIGIFVKNIEFTSVQIALGRAMIGALFLFVFSIISKKSTSKEIIRSNILILILGGICLSINWIFLFEAYKYTDISSATICYYLAPVIVMFLSPIIFKEKLTVVKIVCILSAMVGMLCVIGVGNSSGSNNFVGIIVMFLSPIIFKEKLTVVKIVCILSAMVGMLCVIGVGNSSGSNNFVGILYALAAACLYSCVIILNKFLKDMSGLQSAFIELSIASLFLIPYVYFTDGISFSGVSSISIVLLLTIGIVHTGIAYLFYFNSIQNLESQTVDIYSYVDPISAIIMSSLLLGEKMAFLQVIGGILIIGSTFINEIFAKKLSRELKYFKD